MKNKVILLRQDIPITGHHTSDAGLIGTMSMEYDDNEEEIVVEHLGLLGGNEDILLYDKILHRDKLSLFLQKNIKKKMVHGMLDYDRKANVTIEAELIQPNVMDILVRRSQIIKSDRGLEFHFGLDDEEKDEFPDIVPCPFCGHAAHQIVPDKAFDKIKELQEEFLKDKESGYYTTMKHMKCDSGDIGSCSKEFAWEIVIVKGEDVEPK